MKLTDILVRDACLVDMHGESKPAILGELAESLSHAIPSLHRDELQAMLIERERLGTTAMGDGIAIPHARIESLDRVLAVFGLSRAEAVAVRLDRGTAFRAAALVRQPVPVGDECVALDAEAQGSVDHCEKRSAPPLPVNPGSCPMSPAATGR